MRFLALPSPSQGVWYLGPIPIRAYGLIIACAILIAVYWAARRYETRGGDRELFYDIALWAVPGGIIGARVYHVITSPDAYFGKNGNPIMALAIWNGGLGIWGAVAGGALAAWLVVRHRGQRLGPVADSLAVPLLAAQAIGRWGNWFNQELFGAPTTLPWGLASTVRTCHSDTPAEPCSILLSSMNRCGTLRASLFCSSLINVGL